MNKAAVSEYFHVKFIIGRNIYLILIDESYISKKTMILADCK